MNGTAPSSERTAPRRPLPRAVLTLGLTSFLTDVGSEMIFPLLAVFLATLGAAPAFIGLVEGLADATASVLKLASGYFADRARSKKAMVVFGYGIASVVRPLIALATTPWQVLAARVTDRVGKGIRTSPRDALLAASVDDSESGRAFGFHGAMDHAGAVVGPLVATALLGMGWSMRSVFAFALVPGLLSVITVATVREPSAAIVVPASSEEPSPESTRLSGSLRGYLVIITLFALANSSDAFLLLRARDLGVPVASLPLLWTAFHVSKLVSSYLGGDYSDRIARPKLIVAGWTVYAATYLAFGVATEAWHAWALFLVYGVYYGLTEPVEKALVKDLAPAPLRGRAYGIYNFLVGVSAIPAGLLTGFLWQTYSLRVALVVGAAVALASSVALVVWAKGFNHRRPASA